MKCHLTVGGRDLAVEVCRGGRVPVNLTLTLTDPHPGGAGLEPGALNAHDAAPTNTPYRGKTHTSRTTERHQ